MPQRRGSDHLLHLPHGAYVRGAWGVMIRCRVKSPAGDLVHQVQLKAKSVLP